HAKKKHAQTVTFFLRNTAASVKPVPGLSVSFPHQTNDIFLNWNICLCSSVIGTHSGPSPERAPERLSANIGDREDRRRKMSTFFVVSVGDTRESGIALIFKSTQEDRIDNRKFHEAKANTE
ncbi:MAG: hypothetical protein ABFR36_10360, partial [Acidobacteriota bacterium]